MSAPAPTQRPSSILTPSGTALAIGSLGLFVLGLVTQYRELTLLSFIGGLVLLVALVQPRIATPLELSRRLSHRFVARGDSLDVRLRARSENGSAPTRIIDHLAGATVAIDLPKLQADKAVQMAYRVNAQRRGVHTLGPLREERRDPLNLVVRTTDHDVFDVVWIHPVIHRLQHPGLGRRRREHRIVAINPTEDPMGDFRSLRDYVPGDDTRRIHWASSARAGKLVVREHLELRRATRFVVLETLESTVGATDFEQTVEIAASLAVQGLEEGLLVTARTRDAAASGRSTAVVGLTELLELYTLVRRTPDASTVPQRGLVASVSQLDHVFLVAGAASPLLASFATGSFRSRTTVVRVSQRPSELPRLPVKTIDVRTAEDFALRFRQGLVV